MKTRELFQLDNNGPVAIHVYAQESETTGALVNVEIRDPRGINSPYGRVQIAYGAVCELRDALSSWCDDHDRRELFSRTPTGWRDRELAGRRKDDPPQAPDTPGATVSQSKSERSKVVGQTGPVAQPGVGPALESSIAGVPLTCDCGNLADVAIGDAGQCMACVMDGAPEASRKRVKELLHRSWERAAQDSGVDHE